MSASRIRRASAGDADGVAAIYAPIVRDTAISFEVDPPSAGEMARRIEAIGGVTPWLVCEAQGGVAGYAYASRHRERAAYRWSVDVSVFVHESARGQGVGAALYAALIPILRRQSFHRAFAGITIPNAASIALHESVGFRPVGVYRQVGFKLGGWHDVGWWQLALAEDIDAPPEPVRFDDIAASSDVAELLANAAAQVRAPG